MTESINSLREEFNMQETSVYKTNVGLLQVPVQRARMTRKRSAVFTVMTIGEQGLGKSTFIRSLFGAEFNCQSSVSNARDKTGCSDIHRTAEIEVDQAILEEKGFETKLTVIFTPGFGDYTDNTNSWVPVANYIDDQHLYYMCQEEQPDRTQRNDTRVHLCFYFLAPTERVSQLDIVTMRELSCRVNLIPVIAKADSMTRDALQSFKELIRNVIDEHGIEIWQPPEMPSTSPQWPYGIVSSDNTIVLPNGQHTRGRQYRWGCVDISNSDHSDYSLIKDTVFGENMFDLVDRTSEQFYSRQRRNLRLARLRHTLCHMKKDPSTPKTGKISPEDRASVSYVRNVSQTSSSTSFDVAEEAAMSMSGLEVLSMISPLGFSFITGERQEHDIILKQRALALKTQFDIVVKYQEERFDQQAAELEKTKDELSNEIAMLNQLNIDLADEIKYLETHKRK